MKKYISLDAAIERLCTVHCACSPEECSFKIPQDGDGYCDLVRTLKEIPAADVVSAEDYKHLLKIANKMHLWIFNHTFDEQAAYDECGLTDEDNAMLGYGGSWELRADRADSAE